MSTAEDQNGCASRTSLASDQHRAEALLFELATILRRVPVEECTRSLHLRALALKGALGRWTVHQPDASARDAFFDELRALEREARYWGGRLRSGTQLAHRERSGDRID
jgi:hypothetical protein